MGSLNGRDMAVYTEVSDDALRAFLALYDIGEVTSFKGIAEGVENSNYLLRTTRGQHILTLYEKRVKVEDLPFFIGLMEHLAARGVTCPQPVRNRAGSALGELARRPATIVTFLDGISLRRPNVRHCGEVGEALARMHLAGADYPLKRANALSLEGWRPLFQAAAERADEVAPHLREESAAELNFLQTHWPKSLPAGVIHADLFSDNVFFLGEKLSGLIDFYFACNDAFAYDLAICLSAWCFEPDNAFNVSKGRAMVSAYERLRPLGEAEIEALPLLARGAALRFMLTRLVDWLNVPPGAKVAPKNPLEYRDKLRFHQHARSAADYGLMR
jgi:homoserine kinase type II